MGAACARSAKLMVQNPSKQSLPARLAREQGAQITHILPLDASGHHTLAADSGVWGCIGKLASNQLLTGSVGSRQSLQLPEF